MTERGVLEDRRFFLADDANRLVDRLIVGRAGPDLDPHRPRRHDPADDVPGRPGRRGRGPAGRGASRHRSTAGRASVTSSTVRGRRRSRRSASDRSRSSGAIARAGRGRATRPASCPTARSPSWRGTPASDDVDARRFRMLIELDGAEPHEEDTLDRPPGRDRRGGRWPSPSRMPAARSRPRTPTPATATSTRSGRSSATAACARASTPTSASWPTSRSRGGSGSATGSRSWPTSDRTRQPGATPALLNASIRASLRSDATARSPIMTSERRHPGQVIPGISRSTRTGGIRVRATSVVTATGPTAMPSRDDSHPGQTSVDRTRPLRRGPARAPCRAAMKSGPNSPYGNRRPLLVSR